MTEIRDAATIVLLREGRDPFEIFMLRRHHGHEFMANAWVFPGGRVDDRDRAAGQEKRISGLDGARAREILGGDLDESTALALYVAALRETFEEAGLLLARRHDEEELLSFEDPIIGRQFKEFRQAVDTEKLSMAELAQQQNLILEAADLAYLAHWITPDFESRRYDTRFFVGLAPPQQRPSHDDGEMTHSAWWTPRETLERYDNDQILLAPPTIRILEELSEFTAPNEVIKEVRARSTPPAILPHPIGTDSGDLILTLPGDSEYPTDGVAGRDGITRMIRRDGKWYSL